MYVDNIEIDGNVKLLLSNEGIKLCYSNKLKSSNNTMKVAGEK